MKDFEKEKLQKLIKLEPRANAAGVVQIKQREFDPKTGVDLGLKVTEELTKAELDSRIAEAQAKLTWLQALASDFDAVVVNPT